MTLPPDIEFEEDIRLFIYRPRGLLNEASVDRAVTVLGDLEAKLKEPFNRFSDTSEIDRVELNYEYVIHVSLYRVLSYADRPPVKSAILATDPTVGHYFQLHAVITQGSQSMSEYLENEKTPRNGSVFLWNGSLKGPLNGAIKQRVMCR
jgi:hypothetical protein